MNFERFIDSFYSLILIKKSRPFLAYLTYQNEVIDRLNLS